MSAVLAARAMKMHGITAGEKLYGNEDSVYWRGGSEPTFGLAELLPHWTFRSWFSQQKVAFEAKLRVAREKAVERVTDPGVEELADD